MTSDLSNSNLSTPSLPPPPSVHTRLLQSLIPCPSTFLYLRVNWLIWQVTMVTEIFALYRSSSCRGEKLCSVSLCLSLIWFQYIKLKLLYGSLGCWSTQVNDSIDGTLINSVHWPITWSCRIHLFLMWPLQAGLSPKQMFIELITRFPLRN